MNALSSSDDSSDDEEILRNFDTEANLIIRTGTLPKKSADKYLSNYDAYKKWLDEHKGSLSSSDEHYVENSLKTRQRIFDKITGTVVREINNNSKPSTSSNSSTTPNNDGNVQYADQDFEDDFILNTEDLVAIDNLNVPEKPTSSLPLTKTTATVITTDVRRSPQVTQPTHFTMKSPINVFLQEQETEPAKKRLKSNPSTTFAKEKKLNLSSYADTYNTYNNSTLSSRKKLQMRNCAELDAILPDIPAL
ncbi:hypothetical protein KQX54_010085 [Cotesia glomerata]|uniref:Uncharacterized protein n=1 Tax=Cotesia glomerata TaxID=32391 RepID=A0AAV7I9W7_COTGL|nr:hypothetical protein KQX54_010085 [Cotesia glomerata]